MSVRYSPRIRGFSLIEILVAVVILATGLLALTALQGSLTKASAEAKVRSRVAAFMAGRMEFLRNGPYDTIFAGSDSCATTASPDWVPASLCADAAIGSFTATQVVSTWAGETTFTEVASALTDPKAAQFKRVTLTATWVDSAGSSRTLRSVSDISPLGLISNLIIPPEAQGSGSQGPRVRQDNPVTEGMIPVALGDGSASAASNPKPELKQDGRNQRIVATRFNVLNYTPEGDGSTVIQKRFENEIVRCKCTKGADTSTAASIFYEAKWPAIWTGDQYELYAPATASTAAPGQAVRSAPKAGLVQSELCTQCCRDHHDSTGSDVKFDPERILFTGESTGREKYSRDGAGAYSIAVTGDYVDACRVIRVDGFWRVAADTYSRQFGLLETKPVLSVQARSGLITDGAPGDPSNAKGDYATFVKNYALGYASVTEGGVGTSPSGADSLFAGSGSGLNPATIVVRTPNVNGDWRYLHARGLYIDYLESGARKRIADAVADCSRAQRFDCILPYLPFTTINLTEIAEWQAENDRVLQVNSSNIMSSNQTEPFGGRTKGIAATVNAADDENIATSLKSNSGLAVFASVNDTDGDGVPDIVVREAFGIDREDNAQFARDTQAFQVLGNSGRSFYVRYGTGTSRTARYSIGSGDSDDCTTPNTGDIRCVTQSQTGPLAGTFTLGNYWSETSRDDRYDISPTQCRVVGGTGFTGLNNERVSTPLFINYRVSGVSVVAGTGSVTTTMPAPAVDLSLDGKTTETTTIAFNNADSTAVDTIFAITFAEQSRVPATIDTCTVTKAPNGNNWSLTVDSWTRPWQQP